MGRSSSRIENLSPQKRELLLHLMQQQSETARQKTAIPRRARDGALPLSYAQQRLWFLDQMEPGNPFYNIFRRLRIRGDLNFTALERGLADLARRHESLRTIFPSTGGQPDQIILPAMPVALPIADLASMSPVAREAERLRLAHEEARRPFDLAHGPLLRARLVRLDGDEHDLFLSLHHIVADGWSMGILVSELGACYAARLSSQSAALPNLPIQYADYAAWQREWLRTENVLDRQLAYWKKQLDGAPAMIELPTDRPRPARQSFRGASHDVALPAALTQRLRAIGRQEGATLYMALLAAWMVLLHRYTRQPDIVVGTPIANRQQAELGGLIGFFINALALRCDLSGEPGYREVLRRVRETCLAAYANQDAPFEKLVEELHPERRLSHAPLFQVMFALQNAAEESWALRALRVGREDIDSEIAKYDLTLALEETHGEVRGVWEYSTDLFDAGSIACMAAHFETLLAGITADPDRCILDLELMPEAEQRCLLVDWQGVRIDRLSTASVVDLFETQAAQTPDAVAVTLPSAEGDRCLTYHQLNRRASQIAHHLCTLGIEPETCVGLCVTRSPEMIAGLLGILKAGGVYLPLDPAYPAERLAFMQADSAVRFLLTYASFVDRLPAHSTQVICLDTDLPPVLHSPFLHSSFPRDHSAYIIYTSGSTGAPKGVLVSHGALADHCHNVRQAYALNAADRVFQFATLNFDTSLEQIVPALTIGATIILRGEDLWPPEEFCRQAADLALTVANLPTAYWHQVARAWAGRTDASRLMLRLTIIGGEAMPPESLSLWRQTPMRSARLLNAYGPTEATITATLFEVDDRLGPNAARVPIGRPMANRMAYIVDDRGRLAPIGVPGELWLGGAGVAHGYLNRPDLTAERFVPTPPLPPPSKTGGETGGGRVYKTGDLARWLPDGNIEFLGRADHQVKLRGFRIELGEIESALEQHPAVRQAIVILSSPAIDPARAASRLADARLVAYVVCDPANPPTSNDLRRFLQAKLPDFMLPSFYMPLDALPLTSSGKIDRRALPPPDRAGLGLVDGYVAPRTSIEDVLASVWASVLGLERVGVRDNFFDLGGHSLIATQLVSRLRETFQIELPLHRLFEAPTVADLAGHVEAALRAGWDRSAPPMIRHAVSDGAWPLSFAQELLWVADQLEPGNPAYNLPAAFRLTGALDVDALTRALETIVGRHAALRTTFALRDDRPEQIVAPQARFHLDSIDLRDAPAGEREATLMRRLLEEAGRPFDLARGPLLRAALFRLDAQDHALLLTMHHIVSDGWSVGVLIRECTALYAAFAAGGASPLPDLLISYADFAIWQRGWLQGRTLEAQLAYWRKQLAAATAPLDLLFDRPQSAVRTFKGGRESFTLPPAVSDSLRALSRQSGVTLFMALLAAFKVLLHRYTAQTDIVLATPSANRNRAEIEDLIGFFVNTLALRTDLSGNPSFREVLRRVRQTCLEAYAHQDVPVEKLMEELRPQRDAAGAPLIAQVGFAFQNAGPAAYELPGLTFTRLDLDIALIKNALTLDIWEGGSTLAGAFVYSADVFNATTIARMAREFQATLEALLTDPDRTLDTFESLARSKAAPHARLKDYAGIYRLSNLTRNQLLIWTGQKLQADVPLYNVLGVVHLSGAIDVECFRRALQTVIHSSDALRTVIDEVDGVPRQRVRAPFPYRADFLDFSGEPDPHTALDAWRLRRSARIFDLRDCLFDMALIKLGSNEFVWFMCVHHLVTDGWSFWLIFQRFSECYALAVQGQLPDRIDLPSYQSYVQQERAQRDSGRYRKAEAYWERKLAEDVGLLTFYGRPIRRQGTRIQRVSCDLGEERSERIKELAARVAGPNGTLNASVFNILAATLAAYLHRLSGNHVLSIGVPFHNRPSATFKHTIGLFMEMLPLHLTVDARSSFLSLIEQAGREAFETLRHHSYAVGNPLQHNAYDVYLNYLVMTGMTDFGGVPAAPEWFPAGHANESLTVHLHDFDLRGSFLLDFDFHCDVFNAEQRERAVEHFLRLLDACLEDCEQLVARVDLLPAEERRRVLVEFNRTDAPLPDDLDVIHLFEQQARRVPGQTALVFGDRALTYAQLDEESNRLARYLQSLGVKPETLVGLFMERSPEMIIGVLGVLKAGGAYLPLDPEYPADRIAFMIEDSGVAIFLTQQHLAASLPAPASARVVCLDADWPALSRSPFPILNSSFLPDNLAYVIYTSGSTGRSKGALLTRRNLLNAYLAWESAYRLHTDVRSHLQMASFSFDVFAGDLVRALCSGGKLVLCPRETLLDAPQLYALMRREQVDAAEFVPAVLRNLVEYLESTGQDLNFVRLLVCGSDSWSVGEHRRFRRLCGPQTRLINSFGLTEATIDSSYFEMGAQDLPDDQLMPIGRPFANMQLYILDLHGQPVPIGVPGELHVGGFGLARGYLNRPELTADRFIPPPPFPPPSETGGETGGGQRLYRTGDLARFLPDGNIEFLGRIDHQVKIRGFRVEPGEIENVLLQHPAVRQAIIVVTSAARDGSIGVQRLIAYVVPYPGEKNSPHELRRFLQTKLPDYMLPSAFMVLDALPLTPNGKIDRRALPAPSASLFEREYVAPRDPVEKALAILWAEALGLGQVGAHDNFFELGGHSLLAVQVMSQLRQVFPLDMPLRFFFGAPTVAELAERVRAAGREARVDVAAIAEVFNELDQLSDDAVSAQLAVRRST